MERGREEGVREKGNKRKEKERREERRERDMHRQTSLTARADVKRNKMKPQDKEKSSLSVSDITTVLANTPCLVQPARPVTHA